MELALSQFAVWGDYVARVRSCSTVAGRTGRKTWPVRSLARLHPGNEPGASQQTGPSGGGGKPIRLRQTIALVLLLGCFAPGAVAARYPIAVGRSRLLVTVYKSGLFSLFAHNHEIEAPIASGSVEINPVPAVQLRVETASLRVLDLGVDAETRQEIQHRMLSPQVLDAKRYPVIRFVSQKIEKTGQDQWRVEGNLTLHGVTRPLTFEVRESQGAYSGRMTLLQTDFGITPIRVAGGTVQVKNALQIRFKIRLRHSSPAARPATDRIE